ncbi:SDR family oxidoreductase [Novispirillum itersonii]|uniref:3-oxoacyl-[acyl-carrier protein] reductase n=1 Tax=Novispirillum itersonii TaxID=189 RepID=A0A7W9ZGR2_NOVIT|nr:SDR family oxidoreductase [Novispirillum itersonii]MBB6211191.1 3-oxoacyl-[acyl-carrier protein] reductase [Novispirillum itersonii]
MDLGLQGKTALVLGAGGGLGGAIARALAREGAQVALGDLSTEAVERTAAEINETGGRALPLTWDVAGPPRHGRALPLTWDLGDLSQIDGNVSRIEEIFGPVDILVNNTGGPPPTPVSGQSAEVWAKYFQSMVLSVISLTDRVLPGMKARGWGRVITSTSSGVVAPIPNLGLSNALRVSLVGWSKTLAREVGRDGITSNIVLPGRIATPRITFLDEQKARREGRPVEEVAAESIASIPVGRYGNPEEYGDVVAFLASTRAAYLTGSVIRVDGGLIPSL